MLLDIAESCGSDSRRGDGAQGMKPVLDSLGPHPGPSSELPIANYGTCSKSFDVDDAVSENVNS